MLQFEELKQTLEGLQPDLDDLADALGLRGMQEEISQLDERAAMPGFWDDMEQSQKILQRSSTLKNKIASYEKLRATHEDALALVELANEEEDLSLLPEAQSELEKVQTDLEAMRLTTLLKGEYDSKNAILAFHAGAGGTEAQDWAAMLYRMYCRWGERHGFQVKILD